MYTDDYIISFEKEIDNIKTTISSKVFKIQSQYPSSDYNTLNRFHTYKYGNIALEFIEKYKTAMEDNADKDTKTNLIKEIKSNYNRMNYKVSMFEKDFEEGGIVKTIAKPF